jgi:hypothetical protein
MGFAGLDKTIGAGLITGGLGLILAKDGNKSGVPIILLAMVLTIYPACSSSQMDNAMTKTTQVATTCPRPWGR